MKIGGSIGYQGLFRIFALLCTLAFLASQFVSKSVSKHSTTLLREREISLIHSSIESGPLTLAHFHSGTQASEALENLFRSKDGLGRMMVSAEIKGGENSKYTYAAWHSGKSPESRCLSASNKKYTFEDTISPFWVEVSVDLCAPLPEEDALARNSMATATVIYLIVFLALLACATPIASSLRAASSLFKDVDQSHYLKAISFRPIRDLAELAQKSSRLEREAAISNLAKQVAHDIRSPVTALKIALRSSNLDTEAHDIATSALASIGNIAEDLLSFSRSSHEKNIEPRPKRQRAASVSQIIEMLIKRKKIEYIHRSNISFEFSAEEQLTHTSSPIESDQLLRILSNIVNNSVESIDDVGIISVKALVENSMLVIEVDDNGKGMPEEVVKSLGNAELTYGKPDGNGVGLYHASKVISENNGRFVPSSQIHIGTRIRIELPLKGAAD